MTGVAVGGSSEVFQTLLSPGTVFQAKTDGWKKNKRRFNKTVLKQFKENTMFIFKMGVYLCVCFEPQPVVFGIL